MKKILIIDDDPLVGKMLVSKLMQEAQKRGVTIGVSRALDGKEGLAAIKEEIPDLLVLDIMMPKLSGFEVLAALKESGLISRMHIVVVSNLGDPETLRRTKDLGAHIHFIKADSSVGTIIKYCFEKLS